MASLEGQTLGKYRILEALGRGGMARVYRAYHPRLDRYVAIKVMRSDLTDDEEFLARFHREARAVANLRHPNIVQVHDFDMQDDTYYMVMELMEGDTLKMRLNEYRVRGEQMPWGEMLRIMLDVLEGLAYAHSEGMIHRDIKPANILLTRRGQAVLGDFGIAHIVGGTQYTAAGALMGTLEYMAPEQGMYGRSDARSDIYSLGVVFYEMLTQRIPFDADTPLAILMKHVNDPLPLPRKLNAEIPLPLEKIILKALAKTPEERYAGALEMATALRAAAEEAGIALPARVSLHSFTTPEAPAEAVEVISGTTRRFLAEAEADFADYDTDTQLQEHLTAGAAPGALEGGEPDSEAGDHPATSGSMPDGARLPTEGVHLRVAGAGGPTGEAAVSPTPVGESLAAAATAAASALVFALKRDPSKVEKATPAEHPPRSGMARAILTGLAVPVIGNALLMTAAGVTGQWAIFGYGWPAELFLASGALFIIMAMTQRLFLLVPAAMVFVNGLILTYCMFTGFWHHWFFLWLLEPWTLIGSFILVRLLGRQPQQARRVSRLWGWALAGASVLLAALIPGWAIAFRVLQRLVNFILGR